MTDHSFGRRTYDDLLPVVQALGRIEGRTEEIVAHLERLNGRVGRAEDRLGSLERVNDRTQGASQERGRWRALAVAVGQKAIPAGGGIAGFLALWHALASQK